MRRGDCSQHAALPRNVQRLSDNQELTGIKPGHDVAYDISRAQAERQSEGQRSCPRKKLVTILTISVSIFSWPIAIMATIKTTRAETSFPNVDGVYSSTFRCLRYHLSRELAKCGSQDQKQKGCDNPARNYES